MFITLYAFEVTLVTPDVVLVVKIGAVSSSAEALNIAMQLAEETGIIADGDSFKIDVKRSY